MLTVGMVLTGVFTVLFGLAEYWHIHVLAYFIVIQVRERKRDKPLFIIYLSGIRLGSDSALFVVCTGHGRRVPVNRLAVCCLLYGQLVRQGQVSEDIVTLTLISICNFTCLTKYCLFCAYVVAAL